MEKGKDDLQKKQIELRGTNAIRTSDENLKNQGAGGEGTDRELGPGSERMRGQGLGEHIKESSDNAKPQRRKMISFVFQLNDYNDTASMQIAETQLKLA